MPQFLYPHHNYLGPGNPLQHGKPVDKADEIAREHDYAYASAHSKDDIYSADLSAIKKFGYDFVQTGNPADVVGFVGLGAKTSLEHITGTVFYGMPKGKDRGYDVPWGHNRRGEPFYNKGQKLWKDKYKRRSKSAGPSNRDNEAQGGSSSAARSVPKRVRRETSPEAEPEEAVDQVEEMDVQADAPAGGVNVQQGSGGAGTGVGNVVVNEWPNGSVLSFKRSRLFTSWANKYVQKVIDENHHSSCMLPLATVPVELVMFYLSPAEFERLPLSARVQEVRVSVTPVGSKIVFSTNEANAKLTNSTQTIFGMSAYGLYKTGYCSNAKILTRGDKQVMQPLTFDQCSPKDDWMKRLWGDPGALGDFSSTMCAIRAMLWYDLWGVPGSKRLKTYYPDLSKHVEMWEFHGMIGQTINYVYKPSNGIIKDYKFIDLNIETKEKKYSYHSNAVAVPASVRINDKDAVVPAGEGLTQNNVLSKYEEKLIENYGTIIFDKAPSGVSLQPSLHVGIHSVQTNAPDDGGVDPEFVNACAYWQVDSEIIISFDHDCPYTSSVAADYGRNGHHDFMAKGLDSAPNYYDNYHTYNVLCREIKK